MLGSVNASAVLDASGRKADLTPPASLPEPWRRCPNQRFCGILRRWMSSVPATT